MTAAERAGTPEGAQLSERDLKILELERDWFRAQGAGVEMLWHPGGHEIAQDEIAAAARFLGARGGEDRRSA